MIKLALDYLKTIASGLTTLIKELREMALDFTKVNAGMTSLQNQMAAAISTIQADAADRAAVATAQAQIAQDATDTQTAQGQIDALSQQIATLQAAMAAAGVPIP